VIIQVEVAAPKVIVPLASSRDMGYLHLDCGHLSAHGGTVLNGKSRADRRPMWEVSLSDIRSVCALTSLCSSCLRRA
jgi:hypothetical protein